MQCHTEEHLQSFKWFQLQDLTVNDITNVLKIEFDCRPGAIAQSLALREPKYQETAAYCHFGREPVTKAGIKFFEWENAKDRAAKIHIYIYIYTYYIHGSCNHHLFGLGSFEVSCFLWILRGNYGC